MLDRRRLGAMARKEWIQLRRDPRSMALAFLLPILLLIFFGFAITWDVKDIKLALLDQDVTQRSRALVQAFEASGYFSVVDRLDSYAGIDRPLEHGDVLGALVIPPGFAKDLAAGRGARVQLLLDGGDANTATIALNYAQAIVAGWSRAVVLKGRTVQIPVRAESRIWYNPRLESRWMVVPGLIAVVMTVIAAMLTALTVAREWERGTMEQLAATPVGRLEVVLGKLIPYLAIGFFDVALTAVAGLLIFGVPLRGSLPLLAAFTLLFLLGALGLGIFVSAALRSQLLATQTAMLATFLPAVLLSGFMFDIASMPLPLRLITYLVPARYFVTVTRGIFLKGVGAEVLWVQGAFMIAFAAVGLGLATYAFRKELA